MIDRDGARSEILSRMISVQTHHVCCDEQHFSLANKVQTRERSHNCGLKLYLVRAAGQKCFPQHNPVTG
jgi:hypothetical protein